jgi:hypothetical protein
MKLGNSQRSCDLRKPRAIPWSVPRLRGRGKQRNIVMQIFHLCQGYVGDVRLSTHTKERSETKRLPHHQPCLPRPRKRGTLHRLRPAAAGLCRVAASPRVIFRQSARGGACLIQATRPRFLVRLDLSWQLPRHSFRYRLNCKGGAAYQRECKQSHRLRR